MRQILSGNIDFKQRPVSGGFFLYGRILITILHAMQAYAIDREHVTFLRAHQIALTHSQCSLRILDSVAVTFTGDVR